MPTTFANTINGNEILAKRAERDYAGNDLQTTYATKTEVSTGLASKEDSANKAQTLDPSSSTDFPSSAATANYVNSSVATATANFLGNFTLAELGLTYPATDAQIGAALDAHTWPAGVTPTNNDYTYIEIENPQTTGIDDSVERFKFNSTNWVYEYTLNNSTFTAAEKAAIDSGIDSTKVTAYDAHVADTDIHVTLSDKSTWNGKQDAISDLATIRSGASAGATAVQPGDLSTVATTGAYSDLTGTPTIPTATSDLTNDSGFITLSDVPAQVQADWTESDTSDPSYIQNKPSIPPALSAGNGIDITNNIVSADLDGTSLTNGVNGLSVTLPVPDTTGASQGDVLSVGQNGIEWATPTSGGNEYYVDLPHRSNSTTTTTWQTIQDYMATHNGVAPCGYCIEESRVYCPTTVGSQYIIYTCVEQYYYDPTKDLMSVKGIHADTGWTDFYNTLVYRLPYPSPLGTDIGKFLTVNSQDEAVWVTPSSGGLVTGVEVDGTSVVNASGVAEIAMPTVDQTYNSSSTNAQSGTAVSGAIANLSQVPSVTSTDDGKVLKASYTGGTGSFSWEADNDTTYTAGNMIAIDSNNSNAIGVSTTAGITDIQQVNALPANPVSTVLYLIPET